MYSKLLSTCLDFRDFEDIYERRSTVSFHKCICNGVKTECLKIVQNCLIWIFTLFLDYFHELHKLFFGFEFFCYFSREIDVVSSLSAWDQSNLTIFLPFEFSWFSREIKVVNFQAVQNCCIFTNFFFLLKKWDFL